MSTSSTPPKMPEGVDAFGLKFKEAIEVLKGKIPEATLRWDDLAGPVHGKVFAVAGATQASLLNDLHQALINAKENGTTLTEFRKAFDKAVQEHGWTYNGTRGWRTQVIFSANMRSSAMAGKWQQLQAGKKYAPFLEYRTAGDGKVRQQHRLWNSIVRHIDDPFWQTHYPPNGFRCRCTVRARSQRELDKKGMTVDTEPFKGRMRNVTNQDGEVIDIVPEGIDPGWDHNVGVSAVAPEVALGRKLKELPRELRDTVVEKSIGPAYQQVLDKSWDGFQTAVKEGTKPGHAAHVVGYLDGKMLSGVEKALGKKAGASFTSGAVGVTANVAKDMQIGMQWPASHLDNLPSHLRNYDAALWDTRTGELVVIPTERPDMAKGATASIRLKPAPLGHEMTGGMVITKVGVEQNITLTHGRMTAIAGKLKGVDDLPVTWHGTLTDAFKDEVIDSLALVPGPTRAALKDAGVSVVATERLTVGFPHLKGLKPRGWAEGSTWDHVDGLFERDTKKIGIAQHILKDGSQTQLIPSKRVPAVLLHEAGHAVDAFGGATVVSATPEYVAAHAADAAAITALPKQTQDHWAYFLQAGNAGPQECFAECYAAWLGNATFSNIGTRFPQAYAVMQSHLDSAK